MDKTFSFTFSNKMIRVINRQLFLRLYLWRFVAVGMTGIVGVGSMFSLQYRGHWLTAVMLTVSAFGFLQLIQFARYWHKRNRYWVDKTITITLSSDKIGTTVNERVTAVPLHEISAIQQFPSFWLLYFVGSSDYVLLLTAVIDIETRDFLLQQIQPSQN